MSLNPVIINDFQAGLHKDKESFLLMNDAFPQMENIYNWRGRLKRREGFTKLGTSGRLRRELTAAVTGTIDMSSTPTATYNIFTALGVAATEPDANVELGNLTNITVVIQGSVSNATLTITTGTQNFTITAAGSPNVSAATIDYSTGDITVTHSVNDLAAANVTLTLAYYPSLPVMGIFTRNIAAINAEDTIAFDTKYSYIFNNGSDDWNEWIAGTTWSGNNSNFFMSTNYWQSVTNIDLFWVTNFSGTAGDPIRYTDGINWTNFLPVINGTNEMHQCRFMLPYKGRLLAFNTYEGGTLATSVHYPQRLRYSQNGDPTDQVNGWLDDTPGRGGFIDCPTNEHILAFGFIRDQLIIGMERSLWAIRYTGNEILPFVWERLNSEFGWESMRSPVLFDQGVIGVGKKAISVCDGVNTLRIDEEIPDEVFKFHNENSGVERVAGVRDFAQELVYWTFPTQADDGTYPNRMMVYNYRNKNWAIFKDSFTCFGTWQRFGDITWADLPQPWEETDQTWDSEYFQEQYPNLIAGNQQGYTFIMNAKNSNDPSIFITAVTTGETTTFTAPNHNFETGDVLKVSGCIGTSSALNDVIGVIDVTGVNTFTMSTPGVAGSLTYFGGGELERFENFSLKSKNFNVLDMGKSISLSYIDFMCEVPSSGNGEFTCNIYTDYNGTQPINDGSDPFFNTVVETSLNTDDDPGSEKAYHRFYCNNHARFSQFELTFSEAQLLDENINRQLVQIDSMTLYLKSGGRATT